EATCLAEGSYDEVVYCSVCGEELSRNTVTIPVTDHNVVSRVDIAPTCTTDGKASETYCSVCGTIISSGTIIPALGHDVTDEVFKSGASDDGSYAWKTYKCSRCDYKLVTLTLSIYDENGNPLSGADVIIRDADGNIVSQGTSNEYGKYVVAGLPEGAYTVEVSHEASSNVGKGTLVVSNGSVNGTYTEGGRLWNPSGTGGCKGCACHHNNIVSRLIRLFFTILSLIFNKDIKCCPDMVWYPGIK
ncbi:MAG: carboxypeptidase regulatory-like domain-containing protein, partial [Acutalibacteraceae bacterium]